MVNLGNLVNIGGSWKLKLFVIGLALYVHFVYRSKSSSSSKRAHNFSAGPAALPNTIIKQAAREFTNYHDTGMNIMEISHRDKGGPVQSMIQNAEDNMRALLSVPSNYKILFLHGGAHAQFAAVPLNLNAKKAVYVVTGYWSRRAMLEGEKYAKVSSIDGVSEDGSGHRMLVAPSQWKIDKDVDYVYLCASETIDGLEYLSDSDLESIKVPIVADFTSTLLSRSVDISRYGIIFASGGKNLGPSGFCVVIIREDLIGKDRANPLTPSIMSYYLAANSKPIQSIYNTPPTFPLYMHNLVTSELITKGGVEAMELRARRRAQQVFDVIDNSNGFYVNTISWPFRSRMNVPFRIGTEPRRDLEDKFVSDAKRIGLLQLFGHPVKGGIRVTLYNGIRDKSVDLVVKFMRKFHNDHRHMII